MSSSRLAFFSTAGGALPRLRRAALLLGALTALGCSSPSPADAGHDATTMDAPASCQTLCTAANAQCPSVDTAACTTACQNGVSPADGGATPDGGSAMDVRGCLASTADCELVAACLRGPASTPFSSGPYGTNPRDIAGPFTVATSDGPWTFQAEWTGTDHYVFLVYAPGLLAGGGSDYSADLFNGSVLDLIQKSPPNVHYFFLPYRATDTDGLASFRDNAYSELTTVDAATQAQWRPRLHFVTEPVMGMTNWIPTLLRSRAQSRFLPYGAVQFAIDRTQHIREVGQLGVLSQTGTNTDLSFAANEPIYYNFEWDREQRLRAENATVVPLLSAVTTRTNPSGSPDPGTDYINDPGSDYTYAPDIELPDAATMATFDTLEVDLTMECQGHLDGNCGAWDYIADLRLCDAPSTGGMDGGAGDSGADASADASADGGTPLPVCNTEIARWITSYWRETHWVTDISGMLPFLQGGGRKTFRFFAQHQWDPPMHVVPYIITLSLRFSNQHRGMRPVAVLPLWTNGGTLDSTYDSRHAPVSFDVPTGTRKVEVYSLITGHGSETSQCAEFCNHTHHFSVNGGPDHALTFPGAQSMYGCANRVNEGVTPNQFGTWYFGRGGWCPGTDVPAYVADVTADVHAGATNQASYHALINTTPPAAGHTYGNIDLSSYVVFWQ